jgi:nucleoid-associated protein YgaU
MKKILLWVFILGFTAAPGWAQETATQQQLDKLSGQIQDLLEAQAQQGKRFDALQKEIGELREKVNTPVVNDSASREDLKRLATQVQEIDQKRQDDRDLILEELKKLGKAAAIAPVTPTHKPKPTPELTTSGGENTTATPSGPENGHYYVIKDGDRLSDIVKAYRAQGVKVTTTQILKANPGLDPNKIISGKKIFIPDPAAK